MASVFQDADYFWQWQDKGEGPLSPSPLRGLSLKLSLRHCWLISQIYIQRLLHAIHYGK